jgi:hypothetical protein
MARRARQQLVGHPDVGADDADGQRVTQALDRDLLPL